MGVEAHIMREPIEPKMEKTAAEQKLSACNARMADLFLERNKYAVDSPEREAAAEQILALWVAEG
jgi:hypothetical protein